MVELYSSNHASEQAVKPTAATAKIATDLIFIMLYFLKVSLQAEDYTHSVRHVEVIRTLAVCSTRKVSFWIYTTVRSSQEDITSAYTYSQTFKFSCANRISIELVAHTDVS